MTTLSLVRPANRLAMVWPLTAEVASLSKILDVERRLQIHIPSVDDLIRNKRAAGRAKDLADVEALEALKTSKQGKSGIRAKPRR